MGFSVQDAGEKRRWKKGNQECRRHVAAGPGNVDEFVSLLERLSAEHLSEKKRIVF
jgi:hypothetical protein